MLFVVEYAISFRPESLMHLTLLGIYLFKVNLCHFIIAKDIANQEFVKVSEVISGRV